MRYRTMEKYRRVAAKLRAQGLQPTPQAVAKALHITEKHMHDMLNQWPRLRDYAGIVRSADSKRRRYEAVIRALEDSGMVATAAAVARELDMTISGALRYTVRNAPHMRASLMNRSDALKQKYRDAMARIRSAGHPLTRKSLAIELDKPLAAVHRYLWSHPEMCVELGIEYTNDGHRRIYEKRKIK